MSFYSFRKQEKAVDFRKPQVAYDQLILFCFTVWLQFGLLHHSPNEIPCVLGMAK